MQFPNLLPKWLRAKSAEPEDSTAVSNVAAEPEGSTPKNLFFKIGVGLTVVFMTLVILLSPKEPATNGADTVETPLPPPAGPAAVAEGQQEILDAEQRRRHEESRRATARQQAEEHARLRREQWQRQQEQQQALDGTGGAGVAAQQQELTPEQQLYQSIRLEKIQRRHSSLRSAPVALSLRAGGATAAPDVTEAEPSPPPPASRPTAAATPPPPSPAAREPEPASPAEQALAEGDVVPARASPRDPRGWERIDGGQWIEAVLVTQIRGDAPGPAIALVSTPFWSRDRQRILIPRGARFVGRAQAVNNWEQARLSVTFDRLIFDGHSLRLPFAGLSQAGEAGLKDQVNRHYLQTFGAAGAVGVIAGLTLRNTQSFAFNMPASQAARMEVGRSLGESASSIMNRYLNRLPTITIRAGHRIRIYFTSDLLVPRRPE